MAGDGDAAARFPDTPEAERHHRRHRKAFFLIAPSRRVMEFR